MGWTESEPNRESFQKQVADLEGLIEMEQQQNPGVETDAAFQYKQMARFAMGKIALIDLHQEKEHLLDLIASEESDYPGQETAALSAYREMARFVSDKIAQLDEDIDGDDEKRQRTDETYEDLDDPIIERLLRESEKTKSVEDLLSCESGFFDPRIAFNYENTQILLSAPFESGGSRLKAIAYYRSKDNDDGKLHARMMYKSNSDGFWRSTPGIEGDGRLNKGEDGWFRGREYGEYPQLTKPIEEITKQLDSMDSRVLGDHPLVWMFSEERFILDGAFTDLTNQLKMNGNIFQEEVRRVDENNPGLNSYVSGVGLENVSGGYYFNERSTAINNIENQKLPDGFKPDFSSEPTRVFNLEHSMLGECVVEVFSGAYFEGREIEWNVVRDKEGRVWVDQIDFVDGQVTDYGTRKEVIVAGILSAKPIDYLRYRGLAEKGKDYMANEEVCDRRGNPVYADVTPILNRQPWLKEYRKLRNIPYEVEVR